MSSLYKRSDGYAGNIRKMEKPVQAEHYIPGHDRRRRADVGVELHGKETVSDAG